MIEEKVLDTILENPIKIEIDIRESNILNKFLQRLKLRPKKAIFEIRGATLRTMLRISKLLLSTHAKQLKSEDEILDFSYESIEKNVEILARVIATAIHNQKSDLPESLVNLVLDNMTAKELKQISTIVINQLNVIDFISTITSIRSISLMEVSPERAGEIIASGPQSEA